MFIENEEIELKKSLAQLKEGIISLGSMLNKHNRGTLYFGINDEGKVIGNDISKKTLQDITHEIQNNLKPLPTTLNIINEYIDNKYIIKIYVEGNDTPYSSYGRYYIRINDSDILMESKQLESYFINKIDLYSKREKEETIYDIDEIDENLLINVIRQANDNRRLNYIYRNAYEALNKLGLVTENKKLNNAGYYLFSKNKPLTIKEGVFPTDNRVEFGEIKDFNGNIFECIKEAIIYIQNHIYFKTRINSITRSEDSEIPLNAIREIVINSFTHRSYLNINDLNQISIFKSSVRIYNPGGIYNNIDPIKFANNEIGSKIRNPLIANVLYKCGYIEAFGSGFERVFSLCNKDNVKYSYINNEYGFTFIFNRKENFLSKDEVDIVSNYKKLDLNKFEKMLLEIVNKNNYITIPEIAKKTKKSEPTVYRHLENLIDNNIIRRNGSRKSGYWEIIK